MEQADLFFHPSVLVDEALTYLNLKPEGLYIDATFGSGGHTTALLEREPTCRVIGIDWDSKSLDTYAPLITEKYGDRFTPVWGNFAHLYKIMKKMNITRVDGILADFGTSQMQLKERPGFSFSNNTPLDMRMSAAHYKETAADVINHASYQTLVTIFKTYGEERHAGKIARAIIEDRTKKRFKTTRDLAGLIERITPRGKAPIHPATRVFQALRIHVNKELDHIHAFLSSACTLLAPESRLVCISFHSLEDRIVKQFFKQKALDGILSVVTPKAIVPTEQEIARNPASRSAKLRAASRI